MRYALPFFSLALLVPGPGRAQGIAAPWDIGQTLAALTQQAERLTPLLNQLTPEEWVAHGAPAAYTAQLHNVQNELGYMIGAAKAMQKQPEKLSLALDTLFRLQAVESQVTSLVEGVRRYQNPAVGDLLVSVMGANSANRDQLRDYLSDLARTKEQEFKIVDAEAQRCRGTLTRQPPARAVPTRPAAAQPKPPAVVN